MIEVVKPDELSDELLDAEIPCGGVRFPIPRSCSRPAVLRGSGHRCGHVISAHLLKCLDCWKVWYVDVMMAIMRDGAVQCSGCDRVFTSVESFSDYRPL